MVSVHEKLNESLQGEWAWETGCRRKGFRTEQKLSSTLPSIQKTQPLKAFCRTNLKAIENTTLLHHTSSVQTTCTFWYCQNTNQGYKLLAHMQDGSFSWVSRNRNSGQNKNIATSRFCTTNWFLSFHYSMVNALLIVSWLLTQRRNIFYSWLSLFLVMFLLSIVYQYWSCTFAFWCIWTIGNRDDVSGPRAGKKISANHIAVNLSVCHILPKYP